MQEKNRLNGGTKKFNFSNFQTDKARIEQIEQEKKQNEFKYASKKEEKIENKISKLDSNNILDQPKMRFQPRNDLERIFENINKNSYGKVPKKILDQHLKIMNNNEVKKEEEQKINLKNLLKSFGKIDEKVIADLQVQKEYMLKEGYTENTSEKMKNVCSIIDYFNKENEDNPMKKKVSKYEKLKEINANASRKFMKEISDRKMHFKGATLYYTGYNSMYKNDEDGIRKVSKSQNVYSKQNKEKDKEENVKEKNNELTGLTRKKKNSKDFEIKSFNKKEKKQMIVDPKILKFNYFDEAEADQEYDDMYDDDKVLKNYITTNKEFSYFNNFLKGSGKKNTSTTSNSQEINPFRGTFSHFGTRNFNNEFMKIDSEKNENRNLLYLKQLAENNILTTENISTGNINNNNSILNFNKEKEAKEKNSNVSKDHGGSYYENQEEKEEIKKCNFSFFIFFYLF